MTVRLPEVLRPSDGKLVIRDGSIFVLSHLEAGGIDYAFEYRSVAEGHDLRWINLPPEIDLSSPDFADEYGKVRVILGFQRFSAIGQDRKGQPIVYAVTIPKNAPNQGARTGICRCCYPKGKDWGEGMACITELIGCVT